MTEQLTPHILDASTFDLWGSRLIEASAGTGKTWTIAALYVRLVLGHGGTHAFQRPLQPSEILVMTFTRAATRELSDRIRAQLLAAAQFFREDGTEANNDFLDTLLLSYPTKTARNKAAWALAMAAESMDDAAIFTIDSWCQRMLKEHAFDSGNLFQEELEPDNGALLIEAAQDYWRQQCYPLSSEQLEEVLLVWPSVKHLIQDVKEILQFLPSPETTNNSLAEVLQSSLEARDRAFAEVKTNWSTRANTMQDWLDQQLDVHKNHWDGRKLSARNYTRWLELLQQWSNDTQQTHKPALETGWTRLTPDGLREARKADAPPIDFPEEFSLFSELASDCDAIPLVATALRQHAASKVAERLLKLKNHSGVFDFSDMLQRLDSALQSTNGQRLRDRIATQYPVILLDEFQDTSPLQYKIFDQIYQTHANRKEQALLLIGDPKQSIYGFRGADIYSYLQAKNATQGRHYMLDTNFRSTQALVSATNHWFAFAEKHCPDGAFMFGSNQGNPLPFTPVKANGRTEECVTKNGTMPAMTMVHDVNLQNGDTIRSKFAERCAEQIVQWLNDPHVGFQTASAPLKLLRPADIAILVRTGKEARAVRHALAKRLVASVYLSDKESVFQSSQASDLVHWLRAVSTPQNLSQLRAAMATTLMGLCLEEIFQLSNDDEALDNCCEQLQQLHTIWQKQGVLSMLRQTLHLMGLPARWLQQTDGERCLTNYLQLAELLQNASSNLDGEEALIRWLQMQIADQTSQNDAHIVRLESDADLVQVITIHKSKGLQYPLVCIPFATLYKPKERKNTSFVFLANGDGERQFDFQVNDDNLALAERERLREDVRLLYVALTRAQHSIWLGFASYKRGSSKSCCAHLSAAGYLLGKAESISSEQWLDVLKNFASSCSTIDLQIAGEPAYSPFTSTVTAQALCETPQYTAVFDKQWRIGSFSWAVRDMVSPALQALPAPPKEAAPWHRFHRGPEAGNFLHEQLQWLAAENFDLASNPSTLARLQRRCERAGRAEAFEDTANWLNTLLQTPLPHLNTSLPELEHLLPEMEFWLPSHAMDTEVLDALCCKHIFPEHHRPTLPLRELQGMLMGFADLVFEHQGRYWVLDYKSNYLGDADSAYSPAAMTQVFVHHRYDVQAAIYMLALHRLLQSRLGADYQPEHHLGGAIYWFIRGVQSADKGVVVVPYRTELMSSLDAVLGHATTGQSA